MTTAADLARELRHALDPALFATERLGVKPDQWQENVLKSDSKRLILNCTRQAGKSFVTSILATHTAIYRPGSLILLVSRAHRESIELFSKCAGFLKDAGAELMTDSKQSCELKNGSRIVSLPGDNSDTLRGFSKPELIVFDEAAFCLDQVFQSCRPMLAVSNGRLGLLSTPHGKRGFFYDCWQSQTENWTRVSVSASDCPRISKEFLETERETIGEYWFSQEYCCQFVETSDQLFREDAIQKAFSHELDPLF